MANAAGMTAVDAARAVSEQLERYRYQWAGERTLQCAMRDVLKPAFSRVEWESRLSWRDRVDFLVGVDGHTIAVEVKVAGSRNAILRQLGRYAEHDTVDGVVLAATRRTLLAGMPNAIHGKPLALALLAGDL